MIAFVSIWKKTASNVIFPPRRNSTLHLDTGMKTVFNTLKETDQLSPNRRNSFQLHKFSKKNSNITASIELSSKILTKF